MIEAAKSFAVPNAYDKIFQLAASRYDVDWRLLKAIAWQESRFRPSVDGDGGDAKGLFQINTRWLDITNLGFSSSLDLNDPTNNTMVAAALMADNAEVLRNRGIEPSVHRLAAAHNGGVDEINDAGLISRKVSKYAHEVAGRWLHFV